MFRLDSIQRELAANDPYAGIPENIQRTSLGGNPELLLIVPRIPSTNS